MPSAHSVLVVLPRNRHSAPSRLVVIGSSLPLQVIFLFNVESPQKYDRASNRGLLDKRTGLRKQETRVADDAVAGCRSGARTIPIQSHPTVESYRRGSSIVSRGCSWMGHVWEGTNLGVLQSHGLGMGTFQDCCVTLTLQAQAEYCVQLRAEHFGTVLYC